MTKLRTDESVPNVKNQFFSEKTNFYDKGLTTYIE